MLIYGKQIFLYTLDKHQELIEEILLSKEIDKKLFNRLRKLNLPIIKLDNKKAQALAKGRNHQGFFLKIKDILISNLNELKNYNFLIILVGITDVGNIGAIIRTAYSLGVDGVIVSGLKDLNIEAIIRSSSGAVLDIPIAIESDTNKIINELKHKSFTLYGATLDGIDIRELKEFPKRKAIFVGSEGNGIPKKIVDKLDIKVTIKMGNEFNSLNVSVATAILIDRIR